MKTRPFWTRLGLYGLAILLIAGFINRGYWQLDRADQKDALFASFDRAATGKIQAGLPTDPETRYVPVRVEGRFQGKRLLHDNRVRDRTVGIDLYELFRTNDHQALLVNRGWLALPVDRSIPELPPSPQETTTIEGFWSPPPASGIRLGELAFDGAIPLLPYLDLQRISAHVQAEVGTRVLLQTEPEHDVLIRDWRPAVMSADRHRAYAFQWFSFAAAVALISIVMTYRSLKK